MDEQQKPAAAEDGLQRWQKAGAGLVAGYWDDHEIVRRSDEEIRRGEAPVYVRPLT